MTIGLFDFDLLKRCFSGLLVMIALGAAAQAQQSLSLAWDASPDPLVVGYRVYIGIASRTYTNSVDAGQATQVTLPGLVCGVTYYFAVTAYDSLGIESDYSGELVWTVPQPSATLEITRLATRQTRLTGTAPAGYQYEVLGTQDLAAWDVLGAVTAATNGTLLFTDTNTACAQRFYRLRQTAP
jgi:hypothetical protein